MILIKFSARRLLYEMFLKKIGFKDRYEQTKIVRRKNRHRYYTTYYWEIFDRNCSFYGNSPYTKRRKINVRHKARNKRRSYR